MPPYILSNLIIEPTTENAVVTHVIINSYQLMVSTPASILGAIGVILRVIVSTQPNLEIGGGLPVGITVLYIVLGALVSLKNYEAMLELWDHNEAKFKK
jgi:hypothetical protein